LCSRVCLHDKTHPRTVICVRARQSVGLSLCGLALRIDGIRDARQAGRTENALWRRVTTVLPCTAKQLDAELQKTFYDGRIGNTKPAANSDVNLTFLSQLNPLFALRKAFETELLTFASPRMPIRSMRGSSISVAGQLCDSPINSGHTTAVWGSYCFPAISE
jgi:hypothetical protein